VAMLSSMRWRTPLILVAAAIVALVAAVGSDAATQTTKVRVMSRNVYLGADLTAGVKATSLQGLVNAAGDIVHQVDHNRFDIRAQGLADEITKKKADLVGLQEVALWRTGPCTESPIPPKAKHVRWDFLKLLMAQLNKTQNLYRVVVAQPEFDFEIGANMDGNQETSAPGCLYGAELNARLTMRDVILARKGVKTSKAEGQPFKNLLHEQPAGFNVTVTRGWTKTDATVGGKKFRFVNTHLESFDSKPTGNRANGRDYNRGQVRELQAKELTKKGGPAAGSGRVILVGDLNSDKKTVVQVGDALAYKAMLAAGFVERSTSKPLGCCLKAALVGATDGGKKSDFNHKVDHVMTNKPKDVKLLNSSVTGLNPANGFWDSDHAGLFSTLSVR
jgi:endonuclease/exonuclease/phosphatase family metal-dependent hydrolase